jgi:cell fate regulator YaaT (PSP1 superfamily)
VQFKRLHRNYLRSSAVDRQIRCGDFVIVEADRGEDLGVVCEVQQMPAFFREGGSLFGSENKLGVGGEKNNGVKHIIRHATPQEYALLPVKMAEEESIIEISRQRAIGVCLLPMAIIDAEYQFDRHKLTIYYESNRCGL